jgi:molybdenum cofactor cytidylyltransferase
MGRANKLLADVDGQAMVLHAVDAMLGSKAEPVILVTGHEADLVRDAVGDRPLTILHNPDYATGLSASLKTALDALPEEAAGFLVGLGDMPRVRSADIDRLIAAFNPLEGRTICVPVVSGKRGNPVLFAAGHIQEMLMIEGDVGARHLIGAHADQVVEIEMENDASLIDVDTEEALAALSR